MSIESVMPSNHLILCHPLLLLPSIFPNIRVFSNESVLRIRWPKYWKFSFGISPSSEHSGLICFRMDWLDFLRVQGALKCLLQHHSSKASILRCSVFLPREFHGQRCLVGYSPRDHRIRVRHEQLTQHNRTTRSWLSSGSEWVQLDFPFTRTSLPGSRTMKGTNSTESYNSNSSFYVAATPRSALATWSCSYKRPIPGCVNAHLCGQIQWQNPPYSQKKQGQRGFRSGEQVSKFWACQILKPHSFKDSESHTILPVKPSLTPWMPLLKIIWLSNIPWYICTTASLSIHLLMGI